MIENFWFHLYDATSQSHHILTRNFFLYFYLYVADLSFWCAKVGKQHTRIHICVSNRYCRAHITFKQRNFGHPFFFVLVHTVYACIPLCEPYGWKICYIADRWEYNSQRTFAQHFRSINRKIRSHAVVMHQKQNMLTDGFLMNHLSVKRIYWTKFRNLHRNHCSQTYDFSFVCTLVEMLHI